MPVPAWLLSLYALVCCRWRCRCWSGSICGVMPCLANGHPATSPACQVASEAGRYQAHPRNQAENLRASRCSSAVPQQSGSKAKPHRGPPNIRTPRYSRTQGLPCPERGGRWGFPPLIQSAWEPGLLLGIRLVPPRGRLGATPADWRPGRKRRRCMFLNHIIAFCEKQQLLCFEMKVYL